MLQLPFRRISRCFSTHVWASDSGAVYIGSIEIWAAGDVPREGEMVCHHFEHLKPVPSAKASYAKGCEECVKMGDEWVHLRECLVCGHVGCCDSSKNKHATKHFHQTKHAVMRSVEPSDAWGWCFVDEVMVEF